MKKPPTKAPSRQRRSKANKFILATTMPKLAAAFTRRSASYSKKSHCCEGITAERENIPPLYSLGLSELKIENSARDARSLLHASEKKNNKMSSGLTAFGSRVTQTRSTYMLGPRDNKRCLTSRTLSHNSDGLKHNRRWQGHESGGGRLVCRPPGKRRLLSASASPNLQSLRGNTNLFSKLSMLHFTLGCAGGTLGWHTMSLMANASTPDTGLVCAQHLQSELT